MTLLGEIQTAQVGVHPRTPTWQGASYVHDGSVLPGAVSDRDNAQQDGPETAVSATYTRAYRAGRPGIGCSMREPGPWPSVGKSTATPHES